MDGLAIEQKGKHVRPLLSNQLSELESSQSQIVLYCSVWSSRAGTKIQTHLHLTMRQRSQSPIMVGFIKLINRENQEGLIMSGAYQYKVVLAGDSSVGKSSLMRRFADDSFEESYLATIGVDFKFKMVKVDDRQVKLQIWDTAGQERFRTITNAYYKNAQGIILVYDVNVQKTLDDLQEFWLGEIAKYGEQKVKTIVLGNKVDSLADEEKRVKAEEALNSFLERNKLAGMLVSAKTGENVLQAFEQISRICVKTFGDMRKDLSQNKTVIDDIRKKKAEFQLKSGQEETSKKKCC